MSATVSPVELLPIEPAERQCPLRNTTATGLNLLTPLVRPRGLASLNARDSKCARDRLSYGRAVVVVEGATLATSVTGAITMIITGILLNIVGLGVLCWALFRLAIHALPFFVGLTAGIYSFQAGMGPFGAIVIGFIVACCTLLVGRYAFSVARAPIVRLLIGLLFAVPAARAGYDVSLALSHIGIPSEWWRESFAMLGALAVGSTAWARVSMQTDPLLDRVLRWALFSRQTERRPRAGDSTGLSSVG